MKNNKCSQSRAVRVNVNGVYSHTIGGTRAGQFSSNKKAQRSLARDTNIYKIRSLNWTNVAKAFIFSGFIVCALGIYCNSRPEYNKVQAETPPDSMLPLNGAKEFTQVAPRDVRAREYREPTNEELIRQTFGKDADNAIKISFCESSLDNSKHNYNPKTKDDSYGLFQINLWGNNKLTRPTPSELSDPTTNIRFAKVLFDSAGQTFRSNWTQCSKKNNIK